jgi:hypothetical protein
MCKSTCSFNSVTFEKYLNDDGEIIYSHDSPVSGEILMYQSRSFKDRSITIACVCGTDCALYFVPPQFLKYNIEG